MKVTGKNVGRRCSDRKFKKALKAWQLDYIYLTKYSNIFITMTREQERLMENNAIGEYCGKWTHKQLDEHISRRRKELGYEL